MSAQNNTIIGKIRLNSLDGCFADIGELRSWIEEGRVEIVLTDGEMRYGVIESGVTPDVENSGLPFFLVTDSAGNPTHFAYYEADKACPGNSCKPGGMVPICCDRKGEIKTLWRTAATVEEDRKARGLTTDDGWRLADGEIFGPDLTKEETVQASTEVTAVIATGGSPQSVTINLEVAVPSQYFKREDDEGEWDLYSVIKVSGSL